MFLRPTSLDEAVRALSGGGVILSGGTDFYPSLVDRPLPDRVVDLSALASLRGIRFEAEHIRIGGRTTWTDIMRAELPPLFDGLKLAAREVGGVQIQNRGTLAGNIGTASPAGDGAPNLLALDAGVELASRMGRRVGPMRDFIDDYRHTVCRADEIVTAILVPKPRADARSHFLKLGARRYLVISIVMVAGVVEMDAAGTIATARLAIGSCSAVPQRLPALEAALAGRALDAAADLVASAHLGHLVPIDDIRGSAAYRQQAALALTRDLLAQMANSARRRAA